MPIRYDWHAIRTEYITGSDDVTLASLAERHGPTYTSIRRRSAKELWAEQREQWRRQTADKAAARASTKEAEVRVRHMQIAQAMIAKAITRLRVLDPADLSPTELRQYLREATEIERRAMGIEDSVSLSGAIQIVISDADAKL